MSGNGRVKIHWTTQEHNLVANALGYNTHNKYMRKHAQRVMDFDEKAEVALTITPADKFKPVPGKFNILFSMWEFLDLPKTYIEGINRADALVVPCRFCKDLFSRYTNVPIHVCWEGIEPEQYPYFERERPLPGKPFRFLWVGAPNPRKGYPLVLEAVKMVENIPQMEIYIKTTMPQISWLDLVKIIWKKRDRIFNPKTKDVETVNVRNALVRSIRRIPKPYYANQIKRMGKHGNIIFDARFLPFEELLELYRSAHCFILPSFGEGWGLTLSEAMATGAPCIATRMTGTEDFFDDTVGFTLKHSVREQTLRDYDLTTRGYIPDTEDMIKKMLYVYKNYDEALRRGRKASNRIHSKFTWERSARRLKEIIKDVYYS